MNSSQPVPVRLVPGLISVAALAALVALALSGSARPDLFGEADAFVRWGGPVVTALNHLAAAVVLGAIALLLGVLPYHGGSAPSWRRAALILTWAAPAWAVLNVADVLLRYARAVGRPIGGESFGVELAYFLSELSAGRAGLVGTVLIAVAAVAAAGVTSYRGVVVAAVPAFAVLLPWAVRGHAGSPVDHELAISAMWLHLLAVAVWVGGLVVLCLLGPVLGRSAPVVVRRYSALALLSFMVVGFSGLISAQVRLMGPSSLLGPYGLLLGAKVSLFLVLGLAGWWHRRATIAALERPEASRPGIRARFWRLATGEVLVMGGVFGVAAVLAVTPAPASGIRSYVPSPAEDLSGRTVPPPPSPGTWVSQWELDPIFLLALLGAAALYLTGIAQVRRRGPAWPRERTAAFLIALALAAWTLLGAPAVYGHVLFSAHTLAVMLMTFVVPLGLVYAAPLALARKTWPARSGDSRGPREWLQAARHTPVAHVLTHPVVAALNVALALALLHSTHLLTLALTTQLGRVAMMAYLVASGVVVVAALTGGARRSGGHQPVVGAAVLVLVVGLLGLVLARTSILVGADYFGLLGLPWWVDALADQRVAAVIVWTVGGAGVLATATWALVLHTRRRRSETDDDATRRREEVAARQQRRAARAAAVEAEERRAYEEMISRMAGRKR